MPSLPSLPPFRRASVVDQAAASLGEAIRRGMWGGVMPGEHELARRLGISRPSVRAALSRLAETGLVTIRQGRRTRVNLRRRTGGPAAPPTVCVVSPTSRDALGRIDHPVLLEAHAQLAAQGIGWEEIFDATLGGKSPERRLAELAAGRRGVCWMLLSSSAAIQRWFERAGLPVLVLGSCYPGVRLPSIDTDYGAVGWHAAGRMAQCGHRRVAIVFPPRPAAGDLACRDGLARYAAQRPAAMSLTEIAAGPGRAEMAGKLKRLMAAEARPTAILTMRPEYAVRVFIHLLQLGLRIPEDVSLMSRDTHAVLEIGLSELTRYRSPTVKLAQQTARLARDLLAGRSLSLEPHLIIPTFVAGATLARPPAG